MKNPRFLFLPLCALLFVCACSGSDVLNFVTPRSGYTVARDIAYGNEPRQYLDIYMPEVAAPGHPVIVFFYGGRWQTGSKNDYRFVGQAFASKGYTTVIADYRLYPQVHYPVFTEDAALAVAWTHAHIKAHGGNPDNLFVSGHSARGYIAVMLTLNEHYLKQAGGNLSWIKGTIGLAGPYDFLPMTDADIIKVFSAASSPQATQPITYATSRRPPMLLLTGDADTSVRPRNTVRLSARLRALQSPVTTKYYKGVEHIGILLALANGFHDKAPVLEDIAQFVSKNTQ